MSDELIEVKRIEFYRALSGIEVQSQVERINRDEVICYYRRPKAELEPELARVDMNWGVSRYFVRKELIGRSQAEA